MKRWFALLSLIFAASLVHAAESGEAVVRKAVEDKLHARVEKVAKSPVAGLYEVVADGQVLYVDDKGAYFFHGNLFEIKSMKNLTAEKKFSLLPLDLAIKTVRGSGKNVVVTFEDPNCGYCKKLAKDLQKMSDVTVYTFLYAVLGEDSVAKSKAIWCAADRSKAWNDWMASGVAPGAGTKGCDATMTLNRVMDLGQQLGIRGTPYLMFANGNNASGYIPLPEIEKRFTQAMPGV
ncbi:MAG TPA: DsbC family protein [Rhodocyclaceae bacterium]